MEWTTEPPKAQGIYWAARIMPGSEIVQLVEVVKPYVSPYRVTTGVVYPWDEEGKFAYYSMGDDQISSTDYFTHWMGPLEIPPPPAS